MKRLYLTVEGQTEQAFAVEVLQPHLSAFNVFVTKPRLTGPHGRRGGRIPHGGMFYTFAHALADMKRWLREDESPEARFSMMVDLYSLPHDVPGYADAMTLAAPDAQAAMLEAALADEVKDQRFIPYIQVYEFEALLLAAPEKFSELFEQRENEIAMLIDECSSFASPELINHGQHTHPKARIKKYLEDYDENVDGPLLAQAIGLNQIRQKCPHFDQWLTKSENIDRHRSHPLSEVMSNTAPLYCSNGDPFSEGIPLPLPVLAISSFIEQIVHASHFKLQKTVLQADSTLNQHLVICFVCLS